MDGNVLETPPEPPESTFKDRLNTSPTRLMKRRRDLGLSRPARAAATFPSGSGCRRHAEQFGVTKIYQDCNYLQGVEGSIDSAHSDYLHSSNIVGRPSDHSPRLETQDTAYGFRYAAIRRPDADPERQQYVRVTIWAAPCHVLIPPLRSRPAQTTRPARASRPSGGELYGRRGDDSSSLGARGRRAQRLLHLRLQPPRRAAAKLARARRPVRAGSPVRLAGPHPRQPALAGPRGHAPGQLVRRRGREQSGLRRGREHGTPRRPQPGASGRHRRGRHPHAPPACSPRCAPSRPASHRSASIPRSPTHASPPTSALSPPTCPGSPWPPSPASAWGARQPRA